MRHWLATSSKPTKARFKLLNVLMDAGKLNHPHVAAMTWYAPINERILWPEFAFAAMNSSRVSLQTGGFVN